MEPFEIKLKTLTPIWTGGVDGNCDRVHETGIIGSLRWWYEALIRGLGGKACDPTSSDCKDKNRCDACELFGCTGWSRKFKFVILNEDRNIVDMIDKEKTYLFQFVDLKKIYDEEKFLLYHTIKIISDIGSIGGKTVLKPSENRDKNEKAHHLDYGLIKLESEYKGNVISKAQISNFLKADKKIPDNSEYPDLRNFLYIKDYYIARDKMNSIVSHMVHCIVFPSEFRSMYFKIFSYSLFF